MRSDLAYTARLTAGLRALETKRREPLFRDPWAAALAGPDMMEALARQDPPTQSTYAIIRTRVFDDWFTSDLGCTQVVLIGAGFDTRAYRLVWPPGTRVWELDQDEVLRAKQAVLNREAARPNCIRHALGVELTADNWPDVLESAGFGRHLSTAWLIEGVLPYLEPAEAEQVLAHISALSAAGSYCAADVVSADFMRARNAYLSSLGQSHGAMFRFGTSDPADLIGRHGWSIEWLLHPGDEGANFGRWSAPPGMGSGFSLFVAKR